jgi:signal transduction histidine kinase/CheY-like chemotaxis protein
MNDQHSFATSIRRLNQLVRHERTPEAILQGACDILHETRGYPSIAMARFDSAQKLVSVSAAGDTAWSQEERVVELHIPASWRSVLESEQPRLLDPQSADSGVPGIDNLPPDSMLLVNRLSHMRRVHGLMAVLFCCDEQSQRDQEVLLLQEAGDIVAMALDAIKQEELHRITEEQLHQAQKMDAVGQLAAGLAHEFNNLLTVVLGHTELIRGLLAPDHPIHQHLEAIEQASGQGTTVTRSLLTFSRKCPSEKQRMNLSKMVKEAGSLLSRLLPDAIVVDVKVAGSALWVEGNPSQLQQALTNLALNARDAMPQGGELTISVDSTCEPTPTTAPPSPRACTARLTIQDSGVGMTTEMKNRIFEPFFTTKTRGQGTGLGLAIVHGIVEDHRGQIEVDSTPGQGTKVVISLPCTIAEAKDEAPIPGSAGQPVAFDDGLVLLAEDNEAVRRFIARSLEAMHLQVEQAASGPALMDAFHRFQASARLLIVDIDLPRLNGLACLHTIREQGCNTPAIVITGSMRIKSDEMHVPNALLLRKPFRIAELQSAVVRMLTSNSTPVMS